MTLAELIRKSQAVNSQLSTSWIPLKYEGRDVNIDFDIAGDYEHGYLINMIIK